MFPGISDGLLGFFMGFSWVFHGFSDGVLGDSLHLALLKQLWVSSFQGLSLSNWLMVWQKPS